MNNIEDANEHMSTHLQSNELSPIIIGIINKAINTHWRDYYGKMRSEFKGFTCRAYETIFSSLFHNMALEDFYQI